MRPFERLVDLLRTSLDDQSLAPGDRLGALYEDLRVRDAGCVGTPEVQAFFLLGAEVALETLIAGTRRGDSPDLPLDPHRAAPLLVRLGHEDRSCATVFSLLALARLTTTQVGELTGRSADEVEALRQRAIDTLTAKSADDETTTLSLLDASGLDRALHASARKLLESSLAGESIEDLIESWTEASTIDEPITRSESLDDDGWPPGTRIGAYRITERIATGGMGTVHAAEQLEPFPRKVAVKALRIDLHSTDAIDRFEFERRALARMNHPSIAQIFDGGVTDAGRPYFVMEFVEGSPLLEHCDHACLSIPERLDLFRQICDAVQHAHRQGLVHRDLKPSNILVTAGGLPKIIDFGIAKSVEPDREALALTGVGGAIGTVPYMSPEQLQGDASIDTRTDVFSLGVVLYELLVGVLPTTGTNYAALRDQICGQPPRAPRRRFRELDEATRTRIAAARSSSVGALDRRLVGDLRTILLHSLARAPEDRYGSAEALAIDVARSLERLPLLAERPTAFTVARKFIARHRVASVLLLGLLGSGIYSWFATQAMLRQARESVDAVGERLDDRPEIAGHYYLALAHVFRSDQQDLPRALSAVDRATEAFERSGGLGMVETEQFRQTLVVEGAENPFRQFDALDSIQRAYALHNLGDLELAEADYRVRYADPDQPRVGYLALCLRDAGRVDEAVRELEALEPETAYTDAPRRRATLLWCRGNVLASAGRIDDARNSLRAAIALFEAEGSLVQADAVRIDRFHLLSMLPRARLDRDERLLLDRWSPERDAPDPQRIVSARNFARERWRRGEIEEARALLESSIRWAESLEGGEIHLVHSLRVLGELEAAARNATAADESFVRALRIALALGAPTASILRSIAEVAHERGDARGAVDALRLAVGDREGAPRAVIDGMRLEYARALVRAGFIGVARKEYEALLAEPRGEGRSASWIETAEREWRALPPAE